MNDPSNDEATETILDALWSTWAPGWHSLCAQAPGGQFHTVDMFLRMEDFYARTTELQGLNLWMGVHGMEHQPAKGRGGVDDVTWVRALSADFDWADENAHVGTELPDETTVRLAVSVMIPKPNVVINSGHGLQVYWTLPEPILAADAQVLIDGFFRYIEAEYGLHNDRQDLASILRVPGSMNLKGDPVPVKVEYADTTFGVDRGWIMDSAWLPEPIAEVVPIRQSVTIPSLAAPRADGDSPLDWLNETFDAYACWLRLGWQSGPRSGGEEQLTRPGKARRAGSSATFHHDSGLLNTFSTSLDPIYEQVGLRNKSGLTFKPADAWMIENGITDRSEAARTARQLMPSRAPSAATPVRAAAEAVTDETPVGGLNLPPEFWEARPWLAHIRDAAYSRLLSPDAVLAGCLARYAAMVPTTLRIPAIVGSEATFDFIACVVAKSSGGKSTAGGVAEELVSTTDERIMLSAPVGSGEGLVQAFMGWEKDEKGKRIGDPSYKFGTVQAIHFEADEATALMQQQARTGTTIVQTLCSAWSGKTLGQLNASTDTKRIVPGGKRRVTACLNIQTLRGHEILAEPLMAVGFPQRIMFAWAHSSSPTPRPAWPGPLRLTIPSGITPMEWDAQIVEEVIEARLGVLTQKVVLDELDGHSGLVRMKIAALLALMSSKMTVDTSEWLLAQQIMEVHGRVRQQLVIAHQQSKRDEGHRRAEAAAFFEDTKEDLQERRGIASLRETILRQLPPEGAPRGKFKNRVTSDKTRHRFEAALEAAIGDGKIHEVDGRIEWI